jgi:hypothetical protein
MSDLPGRRGQTGLTGQTGQTGQPGQPGVSGTAGDIGETGPQGIQGEQGLEGKSPTGDLLEAVRTLVKEVEELSLRLKRDYPNREEVKHDSRMRAIKFTAFGLAIIVLANLLTLQTISYCFLGPAGVHHQICNYIPGYESTRTLGDERLKRFILLLDQIQENQKAILDLQQRVNTLEGQGR